MDTSDAKSKLQKLIDDPFIFEDEKQDDGEEPQESAEALMKKAFQEQEEYIEKLENQIIKMNEWDNRNDQEIQ